MIVVNLFAALQSVFRFKRNLDEPLPLPPQPLPPQPLPPQPLPPQGAQSKTPIRALSPVPWKPNPNPSGGRGQKLPIVSAKGRSLDEETPRTPLQKSELQREGKVRENGKTAANVTVSNADGTLYLNMPHLSELTSALPSPARHNNTPETDHTAKSSRAVSPGNSDSSKEIADLKSTTNFLRSLIDSMQENAQKEAKIMREEISQLKSSVEGLTETCKKLQTEVKEMRTPGSNSSR